jgi:hypothetical protein
MNLTLEIPDDLVAQLNAAGGDLSRRALEALELEEYRSRQGSGGLGREPIGYRAGCGKPSGYS